MPLLFLVTLLINLFINIYFSSNPILDIHSFRQTQTAITAYYIKLNGFNFNYETPVLGMPWSIPFEFPIFQLISAYFSDLLNMSLTQTGKIISLIFFSLSSFPISFILKKINISPNVRYLSLALYFSSPLYLFWSGTFMIETTALFFTLSFFYYSIKLVQGEFSTINFIWMSIFLLVACLQKITTVLPIVAFVILLFMYFNFIKSRSSINIYIKFALAILIPLVISFVWIKYTDVLKSENLIAASKLTSNKLIEWNYGTAEQRVSKELWLDCLLLRNIFSSSFLIFGLFFIFLALSLTKKKSDKFILLSLIILFISPFLIFTNLHIVHNYYQTANLIYYLIAVALSINIIFDNYLSNKKMLCVIVTCCFAASNYFVFYKSYYVSKTTEINITNNKTLKISQFIRDNTSVKQPIIVFGYDWSSEVAFYAERRALMIPNWGNFSTKAIKSPDSFLGENYPSAIVLCPTQEEKAIRDLIQDFYPSYFSKIVEDCEIFIVSKKQ